MEINGINGAATQMGRMGMNQATDSYSRNIQKQIADAQKQLQELSANTDMSLEEKTKRRQEIQQEISDLNLQLRQRQIEQRREKQQQQSSFDDLIGGKQKTGAADTGVIVSLSTTKEQIAGLKKVQTDLQGKLRAAETEEERASLQEKIDQITNGISEKAKEMQETISNAQKTEQDKTDTEKGREEKDSGETAKEEREEENKIF